MSAGAPDFADRVGVVDDGSTDTTAERGCETDACVEVIRREQNRGFCAAIVSGYRKAVESERDVTCVMADDGQMPPDDLERLAGPVARGEVDSAKANRLSMGQAWELMPRTRYRGTRSCRSCRRSPQGTGARRILGPGTRPSASRPRSCSISTVSS